MAFTVHGCVNLQQLVLVKWSPAPLVAPLLTKNLKHSMDLRVVNSFVANHAKLSGPMLNSLRKNTQTGKLAQVLTVVFWEDIRCLRCALSAELMISVSWRYIILIRTITTMPLKIWLGCVTIATTLYTMTKQSTRGLWRL